MTPLKVYVAGSSVERHKRAIPIIKMLSDSGVIITHDWTADMQQFSNSESSDADVPDKTRIHCADEDFNGIRLANYVLLLVPDERGSSGAWTEFGYACGQSVPVVVTGLHRRRTIFTSKASHMFETDDEGASFLIYLHQRRMRNLPT